MPARRFTFLLLVLMFANSVLADCKSNDKLFFEDKERGWFWGEYCTKDKKKKNEQNATVSNDDNKSTKYKISPKTTNIQWDILDTLTRDSIKQIEKETRDIAVTYPTYENVREYKKLQKYISDKAKAFADQSTAVGKTDFEMAQWIASLPVRSKQAIDAEYNTNKEKRIKLFEKHKGKMLVMVVTAEGCKYCEEQIPILKYVKNDYGIEFDTYDIDEFRGFAQAMKVEKTPDLFLLFREYETDPKPHLVRIGTGLHGTTDLIDAVMFGLRQIKEDEGVE